MAAFSNVAFDVGAFDVGAFDIGSPIITAPPCNIGFIGIIESENIGFVGLIDDSDIGFIGVAPDAIGFIGAIGPPILVFPQGNVTQATLIGGIITLSVSAEPIGIGFQGPIDASSIGFVGAIDDSDIGFQGPMCDC